ncbi:MAG: DNA repair exonuclease, partial [Actinomycetota bacterium]|nr:DNA repair exonuclease [Actinomycetota bacterium]
LRIIHTADIHLGAPFLFLGRKGKEQREQLKATFARVVDLSLASQADLVIIAGDLFDRPYPGAELLGEAAFQINRLSREGIWTVIVPGTHDPWREGGAYDHPALKSIPNLHVFSTEELTPFPIPGLDLVIYGAAWSGRRRNPLAGFRPRDEARWRVGALHASVRIPGKVEEDGVWVDRESIAASGFHYLALGHWHSFSGWEESGVPAYYPGPPEPLGMETEGEGVILHVRLGEEGKAEVKPLRVGRRRFSVLELDGAVLGGPEELYGHLRGMAHPDLALRVRVRRAWGEAWSRFDAERMEEELSPLFFHLALEVEPGSSLSWEVEDFPENTVAGRFLRLAQSEMVGLEGEELEVAEEALRLGLFHLAGRG